MHAKIDYTVGDSITVNMYNVGTRELDCSGKNMLSALTLFITAICRFIKKLFDGLIVFSCSHFAL